MTLCLDSVGPRRLLQADSILREKLAVSVSQEIMAEEKGEKKKMFKLTTDEVRE